MEISSPGRRLAPSLGFCVFQRLELMRFNLLNAVFFVLALSGASTFARAGGTSDYVVAANDGYGLEDCLAAGSQCGQVVADAWCEAHGHGHALAFGPRNAMTNRPTRVSASDEAYIISCSD
jgi:hypothetical protein